MIARLRNVSVPPGVMMAVGLLFTGCGSRDAVPPEPPEPPLAAVDGVSITEADFAFEVQRRQASGRPLGEPQAILDDLIQRQAMLQQAERSDIMQDPAVRRELENKQLGQWLDRSLQVERDRVRVSDAELRAEYDARPEAFTRPEMARLAMLYRRVNRRDAEAAQAALRADLESGRALFLADSSAATQAGQLTGFGTVAARFSEDAVSRYRGGDLGWQDRGSSGGRLPDAVADAGFALDVGAVSEVIADGDGLYVIMKSDARPARVTPYEEVAPTLRRRLIRLRQDAVERAFVSNLMASAKIEINQEKVARLALPPVETPVPPVLLPLAGFVPNGE